MNVTFWPENSDSEVLRCSESRYTTNMQQRLYHRHRVRLNGASKFDDLNDCSGVSKRRIVEKTFRAGMRPPSLKHNAPSFIKLGVLNRHKRSVQSMESAVQLLICAIGMLLLNVFFFIVVPCIFICTKFTHQQMNFLLNFTKY